MWFYLPTKCVQVGKNGRKQSVYFLKAFYNLVGILHHTNKLKCIQYLNIRLECHYHVRPKTIKILEQNMGKAS